MSSRRRRRDLGHCIEGLERERLLFPYEPLEESASVVQRWTARLYGQLTLAVAWQKGQLPLDNPFRYQRYMGDILAERVVNQSPREQGLVRDQYQRAQQFFQDNRKTTLLIPVFVADGFEPFAGHRMASIRCFVQ
jgi:hypothetical protein